MDARSGGVFVTSAAEAFRAGTVSDLAVRRAAMAGADLETLDAGALAPATAPVIVEPVTAIVLAGGEGQRLRPLTDKVPKPLLQLGRTTILERVLEALHESGIVDVFLAVNYKA